ncbi:MAG: hypothetical protein M1832_004388 [Thelocarpon impressellum]|nr:MAG: hypothetical protein M1832_004388 [Thelocarpon impressellum]
MATDLRRPQTHAPATTMDPMHGHGAQGWSPTAPRNATFGPALLIPRDVGTAPQLPLQPRQLRPMRCPNYTPVALRRTEQPLRSPSNPASPGPGNAADAAAFALASPLDRAEKTFGDDWPPGWGEREVTGPPTKDHWKPDASAPTCDAAGCTTAFSLFERRHHCRRCGNVFCHSDTPFAVPLDQHARFHPHGTRSRACERCWDEYKGWETDRCSRTNGHTSQDSPLTPTLDIAGGRGAMASAMGGRDEAQRTGSVTGSVPRNWDWSTF